MSKTLETLKKMPSKEGVLHEHIAHTYFHQKNIKKNNISIVNKMRIAFIVISALAFLLISIAAFSFFRAYYMKFLKEKIANAKVIKVFDAGRVNRDILKGVEFSGYARPNSRFQDKMIIINNTKKYNWADLSFDFAFPIDFSKRSLTFSTKGKMGGEQLTLVVRDANNKSYRFGDISLASNWKTETISFSAIRGSIDLSNITHLRLECGHIGESDKKMNSLIDVTIYIKDIRIVKEA